MPIGEAIFSTALGSIASKGVEKTMGQDTHTQTMIAGGVGAVLLIAYILAKKPKVMDIDKTWFLIGGVASLGYAGWNYFKEMTGKEKAEDTRKKEDVLRMQKVDDEPEV